MYYFSYIERFNPNEMGKIADELYHLSSIQMYKGTLIHEAIESYVQNTLCGANFNLNHAAKVATAKIDDMFAGRKTIEQTNGLYISEEFLNKIKNEIVKCLHNFESVWSEILNYQSISIEKYDNFMCGDVGVTVKPDYIARDGEKIIIFDWKTGLKKDDDFYQSIVYCMYAMDKFNLSEKNVHVELEYLSDCKRYGVTPEHKHVKNMEMRIIKENNEMSMLDHAPEEDPTDHCIFCKYYTICEVKKRCRNVEKITV